MTPIYRRRPRRPGLSLVEVLLALAILSLVIGPILGLFSTSRRRGVSDERWLRAHLVAREALGDAVDRVRESTAPLEGEQPHGPGCVTIVEPVDSVPGLWRVTARSSLRKTDGETLPYELVRLVRDPRPGLSMRPITAGESP